MLKIGLVGAGFMGGMHAACYGAMSKKGVVIAAVADLEKGKSAAVSDKTGAEIYKTGEELIEKAEVDIIDICLPTYMHTEHAVKAMEKGRAVFIEKPVCLTAEEGIKLLKTQEKTGAAVMVGQCLRSWPEYVWLKDAADDKRYGDIVSAVLTRISPKPGWAWRNWLHKPECSGTMAMDLHIHDADFIRYLLGEPDKITAIAVRDASGVIQQIFSTYAFSGTSAVASAEGAWDYPPQFPFSMAYRVKFETATAVFDSSASPSLVIYPNEGGKTAPDLDKGFEGTGDAGGNISSLGGYFNELDYFTDRIMAGEPILTAPLSEGVKSLELVIKEIKLAGGPKI
jgi:predicted dehydrogenase